MNDQTDPTKSFVDALKPDDVASISSAGVSIQLRSPKEKIEAELIQRRAEYNPLAYFDGRDRSPRRK